MSAFIFRVEHQDGTPADPPTFAAAVPNCQSGDRITLGARRVLRVVAVRDDADQSAGTGR
jgi:hypothetical protein